MKSIFFCVFLGLAPFAGAQNWGVGQELEVEFKGVWYPGKILELRPSEAKITYLGYGSTYDEWVGFQRLRPLTEPRDLGNLKVQDSVEILWNGSWYPGRIVKIQGKVYLVSYDGWEEKWNEWVSVSRLQRPRGAGGPAKPLNIEDLERGF